MKEILSVLSGYSAARTKFVKVPGDNKDLAVAAVRVQLPAMFESVVNARGTPDQYKITGSVGEFPLNMAAIPWVAVFRRHVTTSARRGYYVVLLFSEDRKSAVLTLNQGVHDFLEEYKPTVMEILWFANQLQRFAS